MSAEATPPKKLPPVVADPAEKGAPSPADREADRPMTFFEHFGELRTRLVRSLWGLVPTTTLAWFYKEDILAFLKRPLDIACERDPQCDHIDLHVLNPTEPIVGYMLISAIVGIILAGPWLFYQAWMFIAPGLYRSEKRLALPFVLASTVFFVGGSFFGYHLVLPPAFELFMSFLGTELTSAYRLDDYLELTTRLLLAFGVVFEIPVVITFLAFAGIVNWKQLLGFARWWVVISAVIAAILTPPDVGSQLMMLVPLVALYFLSILLAWLFGPEPARL